MASAPQNLAPSEDVLESIFGEVRPAKIDILVQTFETCTFSAHFVSESKYGPQDLLVRLETTSGRLGEVIAIQRLANLHIPGLVPKVFDLGKLSPTNGQKIEFSVMEFISGTIVLESIWQDLEDDQQAELISSVVGAVKKIQSVRLEDQDTKDILSNTPFASTANGETGYLAGGPQLGYVKNATAFFAEVIKANNPKSATSKTQTSPSDSTVTLTSEYEDLGQLEIPNYILEDLQQRFVFCHNDLEPRNILVRDVSAEHTSKKYEVAAIIDWEMAGFYPFAYEYCLKDHLLGSSNLQYSWYKLFKEKTVSLLPAHESTDILIQAIDLIMSSRRKQMKRNVGVLVRERWIIREKLMKGTKLTDGWVKQADAGPAEKFTKEDDQKLLEDVLRSLGRL